MFQFPSNGKDFLNLKSPWQDEKNYNVSIPFKREGLSEPGSLMISHKGLRKFQFPSNGKDFLNAS